MIYSFKKTLRLLFITKFSLLLFFFLDEKETKSQDKTIATRSSNF